jgi:serine/threonine protein phosphatase PrpC
MRTVRPKTFDVHSLKLSPEDGFVLSRVGAPIQMSELVAVCGLEEEHLHAVVARLAEQGAVEVDPPFPAAAPAPAAAPPVPSAAPPRRPPPAPPPPAPSAAPPVPSAAPPVPSAAPPVPSAAPPPPPAAGPLPRRPPPRVRRAAPPAKAETSEEEDDVTLTKGEAGVVTSLAPGPDTSVTGPALTMSGLTDVGVVRTNNEDAFVMLDVSTDTVLDGSTETTLGIGPRGILLLVSDGMGGENAGEVASAMTVDTVREHLRVTSVTDPAEALRAAVEHANARVADAASEPGKEGMGATVVAVLVSGDKAYTAEVGDSRVYLLRRGRLTQISKDQTYVQILLDQGVLTPETVKASRAKNVVLQGIGKAPEVTVAQRCLALRSADRLLLCSDGLTLHLTDPEIADVLGAAASLDDACAQLVAMTKERGAKDNVTVIAAHVGDEFPEPTGGGSIADTLQTIRDFTMGGDGDP